MKKSILILLAVSQLLTANAQEMESIIFGDKDMHLNMRPDSTDGSTEINLTRFGDYEQAQVNFQYWYEDYSFEQVPRGGFAQWQVGVNGGEWEDGDFSIDNFRLDLDIAYFRTDFLIRQDNGYVGINKTIFEGPEARLHIDHIANEGVGDVPGLLVGSSRPRNSYMTIHKPKFDYNNGIAQFADNNTSTVYINGPSAFCQLDVKGRICADNYFTQPVVVYDFTDLKVLEYLLDTLVIEVNLETKNSDPASIGINIDKLRKIAPSLIGESVTEQEDGTVVKEDLINYTGLIPILVKGHQQQTTELAAAKTEIEVLKAKMEKLEALISK